MTNGTILLYSHRDQFVIKLIYIHTRFALGKSNIVNPCTYMAEYNNFSGLNVARLLLYFVLLQKI